MRKRIKSPLAWATKEQIAALRIEARKAQSWVESSLESEEYKPIDIPRFSDAWVSWSEPWRIALAFENKAWLRLARVNYAIYEKVFYDKRDYVLKRDHPEAYQTKKLREELAEFRKECEDAKRKQV